MLAAEMVLWICLAYLLAGLAVSVPFIWRGVDKIDASARGASLTFRLLILPGCVALWPWIIRRWLQSAKGVGHS
ncbi:MAG: hypothetical protein L0Y72_04640 [Gemmataceae bacterium]|nr:hypothetical protein [Gemmataceae bacterium]